MRIFAISLVIALPALAQIGGSGSIQGVVSDPSGAVIPGATVVATNVATGVKTTRPATDAGYYVLSPLPPGEYTVSASVQGFQTLTQEHIVVDALSTVGLNLTLKIGASAEQVTVVDAPPQLNTSDARMGQTIRNEQYTALPLAMGNSPRDPVSFVSLMPGFTGSVGNTAGSVLGAQGNSGEVYVEGMPITNPALQGEARNLSLGVSVESVEQFQLETAGAAGEDYGPGGPKIVVKNRNQRYHRAPYRIFPHTV